MLKALKSLGPEDWVLLICASDKPCAPDAKVLCETSEEEPAFFCTQTMQSSMEYAVSGASKLDLKVKPCASSWTTPAR